MAPPPRPTLRRALLDGALAGLVLWALEVCALASLNAGIGGLSVLRAVADDLAAWAPAYAAVGAVAGAPAAWLGRWAPLFPWLALVALADPSVAPRAVYAGLVLVALAVVTLTPLGTRARIGAVGLLAASALTLAVAALALALAAPAPTATAPPLPGTPPDRAAPDLPNVVLVVVDTLRADHVGAYGYARPTTPNIDALATSGARFSQAWSTSSWTLPAHASLFTGLAPSAHGATEAHPRLGPGPATLATTLAARGYRTVGLSANAWVSGGTGLDRGFSRFAFLGDEGLVSQLLLPLVFARPDDLGGRAITDAAVAALTAPDPAPLFLFVNYLEAHEPLGTLPEPDRSRFSDAPLDATLGRAWMREMPRWWARCADAATSAAAPTETPAPAADALRCRDGLYRADAARIRAVVDRYDAGVAYVDARIGALRAAVAASSRADDTLFVVTSDHGERLGEDGRLGHMVWLDAPLVAVPLVASFPGRLSAGTVVTHAVDLAWVHDWILALAAGAAPPPTRDARAEIHPHPPSTIAAWEAVFGDDFSPAATPRRAVTDGVTAVWRNGDEVTTDGRPATAGEIAWVDGGAAPTPPAPAAELDPATRRALEAIGYLR